MKNNLIKQILQASKDQEETLREIVSCQMRSAAKALQELNGRDLKPFRFVNLMIDGIEFGGRMVICALGITDEGKKWILGLRLGDTENSEVCVDLLQSLIERGLCPTRPLLFTIDGSKALRKAIIKVFGERVPVQRCVHHKRRNIEGYLPKIHHPEFGRHWKGLHGSVSFKEAEGEYESLSRWLGRLNQEALNSLEEAEKETLTVIKQMSLFAERDLNFHKSH